jgi:hypothetical protein
MSRPVGIGRRQFLGKLTAVGFAASSLPLGARAETQVPAPPKDVLVTTGTGLHQGDFTYAGSFRMPFWAAEADAGWGRGLAHRYVNGQLRFMGTTGNGRVFEVSAPGLSATAPYPLAPQTRAWGAVGRTKSYTTQDGVGSGTIYGLYWDPIDSRLYWSYASVYNAMDGNDPSVGFSTLDDSTGTFSDAGAWRFTGRGCKATSGGVTPIPTWFANKYCPGRRLGAGFGTGYLSIYGVGPVHMGPALCAFTPPNPQTLADRATLSYTNLLGYPYNGTPYTTPDRCHRDTDYTNEYDRWNPKNGVGYWNWGDWVWQGGVWIDTPTKSGLVFFPTMSNGRTYYANSTQNAERSSHSWVVFDPADLGLVATGAKQQWQIQPTDAWSVKYPALTYPLPAWADEPKYLVVGSTYDATAKRLYVAVRFSWGTAPESGHLVHAYDVA